MDPKYHNRQYRYDYGEDHSFFYIYGKGHNHGTKHEEGERRNSLSTVHTVCT